ncbi:MAG: hypothetical protein LBQ14_02895 [Treponema sp.]|jgi:hypothetical protein|nr:hypothetical protein [Treponema sp.]
MTLLERNWYFKAGIFLSVAALGLVIVTAYMILPVYPMLTAGGQRSSGLVQSLLSRFFQPAPYVPFITILASVVYSLVTAVLIYYFFEKTQSPEILFVVFFILSFAFEAARIMVPIRMKFELPGVFLVMAWRALLFGRYFGIFSLFAASVYAAGLQIQKQGSFIFVITAAALVIALGVPIDGLSWESNLSMISGYSSMFRLVETGIATITVISFFIAAHSRGSREYTFIGIGALLVYTGRYLLLTADTWVTPFPGLIILGLGTWFIANYLHRVYLWL